MRIHGRNLNSKPSGDPEVIFPPCQICGKPMQLVVPHEDGHFRADIERLAKFAVHDDCYDQNELNTLAAKILREDESRYSSWETLCPPEFQKEINAKSPGYNEHRLNRVLGWTFGERGLLLRGPSGRCKTRFTYQLLAREHLAGRKIAAYMHSDLRRTVSALAGSNSSDLARFVIKLVTVELLFIDDLGKGKPTPTADESLFSIIDGRNRSCKPTFYTMNGTKETLGACITEEYREPIITRITEKTEEIVFA